MSEISAVRLYRADLPLLLMLQHASASEQFLEEVFLQITTTASATGLSEVRGNGAYATGTDTAALLHEVSDRVGRGLLGVELSEASKRVGEMCELPLVRALVDSAVLDAAGHEAGQPLWQLLGGREARAIPTHAQIGFCSPQEASDRAQSAVQEGFRRIKVRVGRRAPMDDVTVVRSIRETLGASVKLAIDANGAWNVSRAVQVLDALEPYQIAWVEQPTRPGDGAALRSVRQATDIPVVADEAIRTVDDILRLLELEAIDGVHLKLEKSGTAKSLCALAAQAREADLMVCIGQMDQGRLGSSVTTHLAASIEADAYELWGFQQVARDVATGLEVMNGAVPVPLGPGTGVTVDMDQLELMGEIA